MITIRIDNKIRETNNYIKSYFRSFFLFGKPYKVKFGRNVRLSGNITFGNNIHIKDYTQIRGNDIRIEDNVYIHENVQIRSNIQIHIGKNTTINRNTCVLAKVIIGKNCSIAPNVVIVGANHIYRDPYVSIKSQGSALKGIIIEDDVWIAANVTILDGVTIGEGSVIAAGAVVNRSVKPYTIVGGVPAKEIGKRI